MFYNILQFFSFEFHDTIYHFLILLVKFSHISGTTESVSVKQRNASQNFPLVMPNKSHDYEKKQ